MLKVTHKIHRRTTLQSSCWHEFRTVMFAVLAVNSSPYGLSASLLQYWVTTRHVIGQHLHRPPI